MRLTFTAYAPRINLEAPDMKGLCAGFLVEHGTMETRYAFCRDGRVLCSGAVDRFGPHRNDFDWRTASWTEVAFVPEDAEFIGHYRQPWMLR